MKHNPAVANGPAVSLGTEIHGSQRYRDRNIALHPGLPVIIGVNNVPSLPDSDYASTCPHGVIKEISGSQVGLAGRGFDDIRKRKRRWCRPDHGTPKASCPQSFAPVSYTH